MTVLTSHAPVGYECPFCRLLRGVETERNRLDDIVYRDAETTAFISPKRWPSNEGHVLVIPSRHVENIYTINEALLASVNSTVRAVAIAVKRTYSCDGISTRQHNEPGGTQDVWHLHVHVFPRYDSDHLYERHQEARWATPAERAPYAATLRAALESRT